MDGSEELGRRERRKLEVSERIRAAAASLFEEKGYDATTVEEIAERADVAKGTLFNHFPRKDALLLAVRDQWMADKLALVGDAEQWPGTRASWLRRLFHAAAEQAERHPSLARAMVVEGLRTIWVQSEIPPGKVAFRRMVQRQVAAGQAAGEFAAWVDPHVAAAVIEGAYGMTLVEWLVTRPTGRTLAEELDAKFDIVFRGIAAHGAEEGGGR